LLFAISVPPFDALFRSRAVDSNYTIIAFRLWLAIVEQDTSAVMQVADPSPVVGVVGLAKGTRSQLLN
jgi:hypothetical protein